MQKVNDGISFDTIVVWLCLASIACFIKIVPGLYLHDVILAGYCFTVLLARNLKIDAVKNRYLTMLALYVYFPLLLSVLINLIKDGGFKQSLSFFYYVWNVSIFILYAIALDRLKPVIWRSNVYYVLLFVAAPVILSEIMLFVPKVAAIAKGLYRLDQVGVYGRFGGVYGTALAGFAMHSFTVLFFALFLYQIRMIRFLPMFVFSLVGLLGVILSGIRAGLIVLLSLYVLLFLFRGFNLLGVKVLASMVVTIFLLLALVHVHNQNLFDYIVKRYSVERMLVDISVSDEGRQKGNLHNFKRALNRNLDFLGLYPKTILGGNSQLKHDMPYLDIVFKHGIIVATVALVFLLYFFVRFGLYNAHDQSQLLLVCLIFASFVFSFKANSVFHNIFMFTSIYLVTYLRKPIEQVG